ncbi:MAG: putative toxin-antitoxin system toxin component, PIN family [Bdellovibrionales bacterium]|nr:putative toxin-antitoxin system toxin component, PIN family [Bdellovibrionales bacterium]
MNVTKRKPAVIDTNIIVSGLLSNMDAYPSKIINAWLLGEIQVAFSEELKQELHCVLKKPYIHKLFQGHKSIRPILGRLYNKSIMFNPKTISEVTFPDPTDHFLLELAVTAKAVFIVTGDKKLLDIKKARGIQILSPKQFCAKYRL